MFGNTGPRPTKRGGTGTFIGVMILAPIFGGVIGVLVLHGFFAYIIGRPYFLFAGGVMHSPLPLIAFIVGAVMGLTTAWKAWKEAKSDD